MVEKNKIPKLFGEVEGVLLCLAFELLLDEIGPRQRAAVERAAERVAGRAALRMFYETVGEIASLTEWRREYLRVRSAFIKALGFVQVP